MLRVSFGGEVAWADGAEGSRVRLAGALEGLEDLEETPPAAPAGDGLRSWAKGVIASRGGEMARCENARYE